MTNKKSVPTKAKLPRGKSGKKPAAARTNQATTEDMQRAGLGIAAKE